MLNTYCIFVYIRPYDRSRRMLIVTSVCRCTSKFVMNVAKMSIRSHSVIYTGDC